jgi:CheY-like chemotaxis protein
MMVLGKLNASTLWNTPALLASSWSPLLPTYFKKIKSNTEDKITGGKIMVLNAHAKRTLARGNRPRRILVVDADLQVRESLAETLKADSYEMVFEESPKRLEKVLFENAPFGAILMELCHPVEEIFDLIPLVKARCPGTEIIFVSRLAEVDLWIESIQRGAYDYLPKPLDRKELRRVLNNALEKARAA